jgi:hypothetical protein
MTFKPHSYNRYGFFLEKSPLLHNPPYRIDEGGDPRVGCPGDNASVAKIPL